MSVELTIIKAPHPQPLPASEEGSKSVAGGRPPRSNESIFTPASEEGSKSVAGGEGFRGIVVNCLDIINYEL